jgi:hypothetical protein
MPALSKGLLSGGRFMGWNGCTAYLRNHAGCGEDISSEISFSFGISVRKSGGNNLLIRWRKYNETSEHLGEIENICTLASHSTEQYGTGNYTYKEK